MKGKRSARMLGIGMLAAAGMVLLMLAACGKKGSPQPPELSAPSAVKQLTAVGQVDGVVLHWDAPQTTVEDDDLKDLAGFVVQRSIFVKGEAPVFEKIGEVKVNTDLNNMSYVFRDTSVEPGKVFDYLVIPYNEDDVQGPRGQMVRVVFLGESSTVEVL